MELRASADAHASFLMGPRGRELICPTGSRKFQVSVEAGGGGACHGLVLIGGCCFLRACAVH